MTLSVLGICASPRPDGNSSLLVDRALAAARRSGATVERIELTDYHIGPCTECGACEATGQCPIEDDYTTILDRLLAADRLVFATPVFFMTVSAHAKLLIDRGQALWVRKYRLGRPLFEPPRDRRAMVIAVGGSRGRKQFEGIARTMRCYLDCLEFDPVAQLFVNDVDQLAAIRDHPHALAETDRLVHQYLMSPEPPKEPVTVELF